ncbi:unnamed protein product [Caenorhabditis bovis]|uniref:Uncharacterized protein n=1 Tax=Caenorhabditis bovis TaxID=2654633 RepID=A0A8S1F389_9PELO|nr:unnamed protein product [Caenorhabditis bovis]
MPVSVNSNPLKLSMLVFRKGMKPFYGMDDNDITKLLNKVGHNSLNVVTALTIIIVGINLLVSHIHPLDYVKTIACVPDLLLALSIWLELAAVRMRSRVPVIISAIIQVPTFAFYVYLAGLQFYRLFYLIDLVSYTPDPIAEITPISGYICFQLLVILYAIRLIFLTVLYKVINVRDHQFSAHTTVFLKPTNTPVTFSSVFAAEPIDLANPYHTHTVYNTTTKSAN